MGPVLSHTAACGAGSLGVMGGPGSPLSTTTLPTSFSTLLLLTNLICFFLFQRLGTPVVLLELGRWAGSAVTYHQRRSTAVQDMPSTLAQ